MAINKWFFLWYSVLILILLLILRGHFLEQLEKAIPIEGNVKIANMLEKQVEQARTDGEKKTFGQIYSDYLQINAMNSVTLKKSLMFYNALFAVLFVGMEAIFILGMYVITLPLKRLLDYSTQIAEGGLETIPTGLKLRRGLGSLGRAFEKLIRDLKVSQERLAFAEKERTWREIAQVMAHEIKNPLTPIHMSVEMLEEKIEQGDTSNREDLKRNIGVIQEELTRIESLVNDFRDFSKRPKLEKSEEVLFLVIKDASKAFEDKVRFEINDETAAAKITLDKSKIEQALHNLFKNSLEAESTRIHIGIIKIKKRIHLLLSDDGQGFPKGLLVRAFIPYVTNKKKGTGIGLAIVKNIMDAHAASIRIFNNRDGGASTEIIFNL